MTRSRTAARAVAALTSIAAGLAGAVALSPTPAQAATRPSHFGFQTLAFATRVQGDRVGVQSDRTAFSWLNCTRLTGLGPSNTRSAYEDIAGVDLPASDPQVQAGAAQSTSRTYRSRNGDVGTVSTNRIAKVVLNGTDARITITGLTTEARAWADKSGHLHASATSRGGVTLEGTTGTPLDDVLGQASKPLGTLLNNIPLNGRTIPGLGTLYLADSYHGVHKTFANSNATVLRIVLEGTGTTVTVGRSWARINRNLPAGVFQGSGWGAEIPAVAGGVLHVGRLANQPLDCQGTGGSVRESDLAGFDPGNTGQLVLAGVSGRVSGVQRKDGSATGWTQGRVASLALGPLRLEGVVGTAHVRQATSGVVQRSTSYSVGRLLLDGKEQGSLPKPGQDLVVGDGSGHDLMKLRFGVKSSTARSTQITAVQVELLEAVGDTSPGTVIKLGNARVAIKRN